MRIRENVLYVVM